MIPVRPQPEPPDFDTNVRQKGAAFLVTTPHPTTKQWRNRAYWRDALPDLRTAYGRTCAYSAQWIPYGSGAHTVDHFEPRKKRPDLAYEWDNFRYVSLRFNNRKGVRPILDPFAVQEGWFTLDFDNFYVRPNHELPQNLITEIARTITILQLNEDDDLVDERFDYVCDYCTAEISFAHLKKQAPFIASELVRQQLKEGIKTKMSGRC